MSEENIKQEPLQTEGQNQVDFDDSEVVPTIDPVAENVLTIETMQVVQGEVEVDGADIVEIALAEQSVAASVGMEVAKQAEQTEVVQPAAIPVVQVLSVEEKAKAKEQMKISLQRQMCDYFTNPEWVPLEDYKKPVNYVMRGDGLFEVRSNRGGIFWKRIAKCKISGFPEENNGLTGAMPRYGKIPYALLQTTINFFKHICDKTNDEVYVQIFWDPNIATNEALRNRADICCFQNTGYFLFVPEQGVSTGSVDYQRDTELEKDYALVCEIHSHNTMSARFSSIDDNDEKHDRFYGVIGELNKLRPAVTMSYVCGGDRVLIDVSSLFTEAPKEEELFPQEWTKRVTRKYGPNYSTGYDSHNCNWQRPTNWSSQSNQSGSQGSSAAYRWQSHKDDGRPSAGHSGSSPSIQEGKQKTQEGPQDTQEVVLGKVRTAVAKARTLIDGSSPSDIKPTDFLADSVGEGSEVLSGTNPFCDSDHSGTRTKQRLPITRITSDKTGDDEEYDRKLEAAVGEIEEIYMQHFCAGVEMKENEKREIFNSMVAGLQKEDVVILLETIMDNGHHEEMLEQLNNLTDVVDDDQSIMDAPIPVTMAG